MKCSYKTSGTCSRSIQFELEDGVVKNIEFDSGCNGNLKGISTLCDGMKAEDVVDKLSGITCGFKQTSCPDQLAKAISKATKN